MARQPHNSCGRSESSLCAIATYSTKVGKSHLNLSARWIHDFGVSKRVEGDAFNFSVSLKF
jgi:hypothetical protein